MYKAHHELRWWSLFSIIGLAFIWGCTTKTEVYDEYTEPSAPRAVRSSSAPEPIGPYSQGVMVGNVLYCAGQIGIIPTSGALIEGGITLQTKQVLDNLGAVLKEAGMDYDHVVRSTVFLANIEDFQAMNEVYKDYFTSTHPPARSTVQVAKIPRGALVEIDFIAVR